MSKPVDAMAAADRLLAEIAVLTKHHESAGRLAELEMEVVRKRHAAGLAQAKKKIEAAEKKLAKYVKAHRADIIGEGDRTDLPSGSVMLKIEKRVKQIKGMLDRLKSAGLKTAIKTAKEYVNWDEVEKFSDEQLAELGTKRIKKELFSYALKPDGDAS